MVDRKMIAQEADAYFVRNKAAMERAECSVGTKYLSQFCDDCKGAIKSENMLEVGCSTGYNLLYMKRRYGMSCYGIDPSEKAIKYGNARIKRQGLEIELRQGFADELPYTNDFFDIIHFGFCLYGMPRELLFKVLSEGDRVLKGGEYV